MSQEYQLIHQLFASQAAQTPTATALLAEDAAGNQQTLIYQALNQQANQLAHYLIRQGVGPDSVVGVCLERSSDLIIALMAILKAGGAYLPLDPMQPVPRLHYFLDNSQCRLLLTSEDLPLAASKQPGLAVLPLKTLRPQLAQYSSANPEVPGLCADNLAYIIYTSGSTGKPKGVMLEHHSVVHFINTMIQEKGLTRDDRVLQFSSIGFDPRGEEIFPSLSAGATLVLCNEDVKRTVAGFIDKLTKYGVTQCTLPTAYWHHVIDEVLQHDWSLPPSLRQVIFGGEKLLSDKVRRWLTTVGDYPRLIHVYGPTEATVIALLYHLPELAQLPPGEISLGEPLGDVQPHILDEQLNPVAAGQVGELYLGGPVLARGYRANPRLTGERFITDPHGGRGRLYKTGDRVRGHDKNPAGQFSDIEFVGRTDEQIKIQGFRVEPDEIQTTLQSHPHVSQAIVIAHQNPQGDKQLVAYILDDGDLTAMTATLQAYLRESLPHYMIPKVFIRLDAMPLTVNGKIDRDALPAPDGQRPELMEAYVAPGNQTEQALAAIWADVFDLDPIGMADNFHNLGGHSLVASQIISRIRQTMNKDISVERFFANPTIAQLARHIDCEQGVSDTLPMTRVARSGTLPVSFAQERVYFLETLAPSITSYQSQATLTFEGELNIGVLERSINTIIERHEIFRTTFPATDGKLTQVIHPPFTVTLEPQTLEDDQQTPQQWIEQQLGRPFDLSQLPLVRWHLLQLTPTRHILVHIEHHMVHDGWSFNIFLSELVKLYGAYSQGRPNPLPEPRFQFVDFAHWQRQWLHTSAAQTQLDYWRRQLADAPPLLELATDRPRPKEQSYRGDSIRMELPLALCQAVRHRGQGQQATLFMNLFSVFAILVQRYSGEDDLCIGSAVANRQLQETEQLIGMIVNNIVLRLNLADDPTFGQLLQQVREVTTQGYVHEGLPFDKVVDLLRPERNLSYNPVFQVMFSFHDSRVPALALPGLETTLTEAVSNHSAKFDLDVVVIPHAGEQGGTHAQGITMIWEYNGDIFEPRTIERMIEQYQQLLAAIVNDPDRPISHYPLLSQEQRRQLLNQWPVNPRPAFSQSVQQCFELQARQTPDAIAVIGEKQSLSYAQLNHRANQLAHHLITLGVGPESLVGVCLDRSPGLIVSLLAILKAGAAYLSLDPAYPRERLAYMIADNRTRVIVTEQALADGLPDTGAPDTEPPYTEPPYTEPLYTEPQRVYLDTHQDSIARHSTENPIHRSQKDHLAYIIYTSGTTGKPKGVMIEHQAMQAFVQSAIKLYGITAADRVLQFASINFDTAVEEIFPCLSVGATLVLRREVMMDSAMDFVATSAALGLTLWDLPTAYWHLLCRELEHNPQGLRLPESLRLIIIGGEAVNPGAVALWRQCFGDSPALINTYGPTESTVVATHCRLIGPGAEVIDGTNAPIGRPLEHIHAYILDANLQPVPVGVPGELYLGGAGLARGYLHQPALSAEQFINHTFTDSTDTSGSGTDSSDPHGAGQRLYKTGDWVRCREIGGNIEYLGRVDNQVKLRGLRIELGEIEARLRHNPAVAEAVVILREDHPGNPRIVAYVVARAGQEPLCSKQLQRQLKKQLPDYMVPGAFVTLDAIPLTLNQKIDVKALPLPDTASQPAGVDFAAPDSAVEQALAAIWREILSLEQVGVDDNFFALGGDSILSIQMISRARQQNINLTAKHLFQHQTIAELAHALTQQRQSSNPLPADQSPVTGRVWLTPIQQWFFDQQLPRWQHYNQSMLLELNEAIEPRYLRQALAHLLEHHDALRAQFQPGAAGWQQDYPACTQEVSQRVFHTVALQALSPDGGDEDEQLRRYSHQFQAGLDPEQGDLVRGVHFKRASKQGEDRPDLFLLIIHHLSVDGISWRILLEDLQTACGQLARGEPVQLPAKTTSLQTWGERLRQYAHSDRLLSEADYWLTPGQFPEDGAHPHPPVKRATVAATQTRTFTLGADATRALLTTVPPVYNTQINDVLLSALVLSHYHCTGDRDLWVDLEGHGREDLFAEVDIARTVGWFTSLFPLHFALTEEPDLVHTIKAIKEQLRGLPNKGIGYGILRYLNHSDELQRRFSPRADASISFNYLGQFDQVLTAAGGLGNVLEARLDQDGANLNSHPLAIAAWVKNDCLDLIFNFNPNHYNAEAIEQLGQAYLRVLRQLISHCQSDAAGAYTPSDFGVPGLGQGQLDQLLARVAGDRPQKAVVEDVYELSPMQQGMLFHSLQQPDGDQYFEQLVCTLEGAIDNDGLQQAWATLVARHAVLRASCHWESAPQPVQVIHRQVTLPWHYLDWRHLSPAEQRNELDALLQQDRRQGFILEQAPLMRFSLIRMAATRYQWVWSHHHLLFDGWSMPLLLQEMQALYPTNQPGSTTALKAVRPYRDHIRWLRTQDREAARIFWRRRLAGCTTPTRIALDPDLNRADEQAPTFAEIRFSLPQTTTAQLQALAQQHHLTLNTLVQGAWAILLSRYSGRNEVVFGATVSGRTADLPGVESMVGLLINTLPVRARLDATTECLPWLQQLHRRQQEQSPYDHLPLVDIHQVSAIAATTPLFDSLVVFESYPMKHQGAPTSTQGLNITEIQSIERSNYPLTLVINPGNGLQGRISYQTQRFRPQSMQRLLHHFTNLLTGIATRPQGALVDLPMLSDGETHQLLIDKNQTERDFGAALTIARQFERQVDQTPDAIAISYGEQRLTYRQLNRQANQLARYLRQQGVQTNQLVGVLLEPSAAMVVSYVAIIKAGGAYLPLETGYPRARLAFIASDAGLRWVIGHGQTVQWLATQGEQPPVIIDPESVPLAQQPDGNLPNANTSDDMAYVMYTSGSTGQPKGVMVAHRGVTRLVLNNHALPFSTRDTVAQVSNPAFDASTFEIWGALLNGARLEGIAQAVMLEPQPFIHELQRLDISVMFLTVAVFHTVANHQPDGFQSLRVLIFGGDAASASVVAKVLEAGPPGQLINGYGPTECTTFALSGHIDQLDPGASCVPLDGPISNTEVYLLDQNRRPVPVGVPGEIYLGGPGLALGYLNQPGLTAERFVEHPFKPGGGQLYKTGDLARYVADAQGRPGRIEFIGRIDQQVKIRGFRVETGEIEAVLNQYPGIHLSHVLATGSLAEEKTLVAYIVAEQAVDRQALLAFLGDKLPAYMLPGHVMQLDEFTLTANGKIDRRALPGISQSSRVAPADFVAPQSTTEKTLAAIWQEVLQVSAGLNDNFFAIGGHSLSATQVVSRIRESFAMDLPLQTLFDYPVLDQLAQQVERLQLEQVGADQLEAILDELEPLSDEELERYSAAERD